MGDVPQRVRFWVFGKDPYAPGSARRSGGVPDADEGVLRGARLRREAHDAVLPELVRRVGPGSTDVGGEPGGWEVPSGRFR